MVRIEKDSGPLGPVRVTEAEIRGYQDAVADLREHGRVSEIAVQIDHEARVTAEHGARLQALAQQACDGAGADIPGDVVLEADSVQP